MQNYELLELKQFVLIVYDHADDLPMNTPDRSSIQNHKMNQ